MKKILSLILAIVISTAMCITVFADEDTTNFVPEKDSTLEGVTNVKDTSWFRLTHGKGGNTDGISIKTDGGHSGANYVSAEVSKAWYSPAINFFPYVQAAAEAESYESSFRIAFYARSSTKDISAKKSILVRCLEADVMDDNETFTLSDRGSGNFYGSIYATISDPDNNGWVYVVTEAFEVDPDYLKEDNHTWWFCFDTLTENSVLDIDDFSVFLDSEYEEPEDAVEVEPKTDISYLTDDAKANAFPAAEKEDLIGNVPSGSNGENSATATDAPSNGLTDTTESGNYTALYIAVPVCLLLAAGAVAFTVVSKKKK